MKCSHIFFSSYLIVPFLLSLREKKTQNILSGLFREKQPEGRGTSGCWRPKPTLMLGAHAPWEGGEMEKPRWKSQGNKVSNMFPHSLQVRQNYRGYDILIWFSMSCNKIEYRLKTSVWSLFGRAQYVHRLKTENTHSSKIRAHKYERHTQCTEHTAVRGTLKRERHQKVRQ